MTSPKAATSDINDPVVHRMLQQTPGTTEDGPPPPSSCLKFQDGIAATNECKIAGENNKCPAGSEITYGEEPRRTIDAYIGCPLDSVTQSDWVDASQQGLCTCEATLLDDYCDVVSGSDDLTCECVACPFGMRMGFAYDCNQPITGVCTSFDCHGNCNLKYDPGNLLGRETFPPTTFPDPPTVAPAASSSSAQTPYGTEAHTTPLLLGTALLVVTVFKWMLL